MVPRVCLRTCGKVKVPDFQSGKVFRFPTIHQGTTNWQRTRFQNCTSRNISKPKICGAVVFLNQKKLPWAKQKTRNSFRGLGKLLSIFLYRLACQIKFKFLKYGCENTLCIMAYSKNAEYLFTKFPFQAINLTLSTSPAIPPSNSVKIRDFKNVR